MPCDLPAPTNNTLTELQKARYARHISLPEVASEGQQRLLNAKVLIIGAGGLGCPIALYLAAAGVGTIGMAEFDTVDHSNLQRQILYTTADVGQSKLDTAAERLRALNPEVNIIKHAGLITSANALEWIAPYDLIINGTDNFPTRYLVNDACVLLRKINVDGSIFRFEGLVTVFAPHLKEWLGQPISTGCYRCQYPEPPPPGMVPSCAEGGVFGAMCGIVGSMQANETIKLLAQIGKPLFGRLQTINALNMELRTLKLRRDPKCPVCGDQPSIKQLIDYQEFCGMPSANASKPILTPTGMQLRINPAWEVHPEQVAQWRREGKEFLLLDVRRPGEYQTAKITGSTLITLDTLHHRWEEIADWQDKLVITQCHHGVRSMNAAAILRKEGFTQVFSMAGGIDAWSVLVDTGVPRY